MRLVSKYLNSLFCVFLVSPICALADSIAITNPVNPGKTVSVTGIAGWGAFVYVQPKALVLPGLACDRDAVNFGRHDIFMLTGAASQSLTLSMPLDAGDQVCVNAVDPSHPAQAGPWTTITTVSTPPAPALSPDPKPTFAAKLVGGSSVLSIHGLDGASVFLYQFDTDFQRTSVTETCEAHIMDGVPLSIIETTGGKSTSATSLTLASPDVDQYSITLAQPMLADTFLCIKQVHVSGATSTVSYSPIQLVTDPNDYGRVRTDFTAGSVITNQQTKGATSTAAEYLDFGFSFTFARAGGGTPAHKDSQGKKVDARSIHWYRPGFEDFIHLQLTSVPVATTTTTAATPSAATPANTDLNVLTSQQSARIWGGFSIPFRITNWDHQSNAFVVAPVLRAGFDTLLNPSLSNSNSNASSTTSTTATQLPTTTSFSSVYSSFGYGIRLSWEKFSKSPDKAPTQIALFDILTGNSTNTPSFVCDPRKTFGMSSTTKPTNTTCFVADSTVTPTAYTLDASRTLVPRLFLSGHMKLPNYPFILGTDANLAQYSFGSHHGNIDPLNKPGNDVRIYFGVNFDVATAIKKLNLTKQ